MYLLSFFINKNIQYIYVPFVSDFVVFCTNSLPFLIQMFLLFHIGTRLYNWEQKDIFSLLSTLDVPFFNIISSLFLFLLLFLIL